MSRNTSGLSNVGNRNSQPEQPGQTARLPRLFWDMGTAYDLFISLQVLHYPEEFGLRPSWAAGVRSRLSIEERKTLEEAKLIVNVPFRWVNALPEPKDGATALWALRQLPPGQRLPSLGLFCEIPDRAQEILKEISLRQSWKQQDLENLKETFKEDKHFNKWKGEGLLQILDTWAHPVDFGERYLQALQAYYQAFFAEEEQHIAPTLKTALAQAQELSEQVSLDELLEDLTQGLHLPGFLETPELVLAPSFWSTPLVFLGRVSEDRSIILFGARPKNASLVPGEVVPDALLRVLKSLADPTRLRILRYLVCEQLTPVEISRRLRLRAPTVTHHLSELRLAGLVHITLEEHAERHYTARMEAVRGIGALLEEFLQCNKVEQD